MPIPCKLLSSLSIALALAGVEPAAAERLFCAGTSAASSQFGSAWCDLPEPTDFAAGDVLRLRISSPTESPVHAVAIRLLPLGADPATSTGLVACDVELSESGDVDAKLDAPFTDIVQISVHGGPNPFGICPLGAGNGPATLLWIDLNP